MLYLLSKLIPVPMRSTYGVVEGDHVVRSQRSSWVQWRGRVWRHRVEAVS